jgi:hypothetical protein
MVFIAYEMMWLPDNGPLRREKLSIPDSNLLRKSFRQGTEAMVMPRAITLRVTIVLSTMENVQFEDEEAAWR